jgi:glutathione S-transferase
MTTAFTIHTIPGSPFARAVCAALIEKNATFRIAPIAREAMRSEAHLRLHPFGRMPAIEHDGFHLYETQAILRYIDRVLPTPALTPADAREAARMDLLMNVCDWYLFQGVANVIVFQRVIGPMMGLQPHEDSITAAMPRAHVVMRELEGLLGQRPFFCGDAASLADLHLAPQLDFLSQTPEWAALSPGRPNLVAWLARMNSRPGMIETTMPRILDLARESSAG